MSKDYISGDGLRQAHAEMVEAPLLEGAADYLIGVKDGKLYRVEQ